ncbi:MAG TPA: TRAP transporter substrate-binding protein DctP [Candidatus Acidoferrum sp.]|jgi:tripartite ATP-independent transporter DctP family solute receptor|nr:TRAP transporter substrate-binding protein DctP [Candidatus Acidoferrum sp.]
MDRRRFVLTSLAAAAAAPATGAAQSGYKTEFNMSLVIAEDTPWGRAANRFAGAVRYRTQGRVTIKNHFDGRLFAGRQTTEFTLLQQGIADFAIGSTINWSAQVKELNLFALPFMFPSYQALDAVQGGASGKHLFKVIEDKGVVPIAWGENGFRELTNSKRPVRRPEDLQGLKIRVVPVPIFVEIFQALGANPVSLNWDDAQAAFREGTVDGQENPIWLIVPYRIWANHKHVTLWHYAIDPVILAVSAKTWGSLSGEDRSIVRKAGEEIMAQQKKETRDGLAEATTVVDTLQRVYGMAAVHLTAVDIQAFRDKTRRVYTKWTDEVGIDLVRTTEKVVDATK